MLSTDYIYLFQASGMILLVERRGQLVTRAEIVDRLWGKDVFVDVENGVNTAIRKLRQALRDSPDAPTFIETVPGKGYRFIATVEVLPDEAERLEREAVAVLRQCGQQWQYAFALFTLGRVLVVAGLVMWWAAVPITFWAFWAD